MVQDQERKISITQRAVGRKRRKSSADQQNIQAGIPTKSIIDAAVGKRGRNTRRKRGIREGKPVYAPEAQAIAGNCA